MNFECRLDDKKKCFWLNFIFASELQNELPAEMWKSESFLNKR